MKPIPIALAACSTVFLGACHAPPAADKAGDTAPAIHVSAAAAEKRTLPLALDAVGHVEAKASVALKARVDGQVAEVLYAEGQPVRKGQLLMRLDPASFEAQARQAEGVLARDEALLARNRADYLRNKALAGQGFISKSGLDQSEADLHAAEASLKADRAALDNARLQTGYTRVVAPIDGVAGALQLPVGGAAKANDTTLLTINQVSPIYVSFSVSDSVLASLRQASNHGQVPVTVTVAGLSQPVRGKLAFIDNGIDATAGAITAKAEFPNADRLLTPGQFAKVSAQIGTVADALVVPATAVENGVDGFYVFVVDSGSHVALRKVKPGLEAGGYRVIDSGLKAGERVVIGGQARLRDKAAVIVDAGAP